jgi:serine/threonine protein phosphatase PrpC
MKLRCYGLSEQAGRDSNDDMFCVPDDRSVFAVADGIGGRPGGSLASRTAIDSLIRHVAGLSPEQRVQADHLRQTVVAINDEVMARGISDPAMAGLGTTLSAVVVGRRESCVVHVGDSRIYLLRDGRLTRLTREHTVAQDLVAMKRLDPSEVARHPLRSTLSRFLGSPVDAEPDVTAFTLQPGDWVLLVTDGLTAVLSEDDILRCCRDVAPKGAEAVCRALTGEALTKCPPDNVTVVAVEAVHDTAGDNAHE